VLEKTARGVSNRPSTRLREYSAMDVTDDYTAQNLSARQRDVMNLIERGLSNKEIASILNLAEGMSTKR
jgi:DNA-binding NarL/FixJ family response regulator